WGGMKTSASGSSSELCTARPSRAILAQVVVGHVPETEPDRKNQANSPGQSDTPEDPIRHAVDELDGCRVAVVAHVKTAADAPEGGEGRDGHDERGLTPRIAQQPLFFFGWLRGISHSRAILFLLVSGAHGFAWACFGTRESAWPGKAVGMAPQRTCSSVACQAARAPAPEGI